MDKNTIKPEEKTIRNLFNGDESFIFIPKYQRPFSWNKDNAEKFYEDIFKEELIKSKNDYFLGSILLNKIDNETIEVVDGQQRITTISLFFLALFLLFKDKNPENIEASEFYKFIKKGSFNQKKNILILSRSNNDFYVKLTSLTSIDEINNIDVSSESKSNKEILEILKFFIEQINKNKNDDVNLENKRLENIYSHLCNRVFFIAIITQGYKQASKLFEVLNNRGTDLTEADLIRNYLLSRAEKEGFGDGVANWEEFEKNIGLDNLEQFLRYSSLLISQKDSTYERITEFTDNGSSKTTLDFLKELSYFYLQILSPGTYSEVEENENLLEDLNILNATQVRSVLLAAYEKYETKDIIELIKYLVQFTFRYATICGFNPNKLENKYSELAFNIYKNAKPLNEVILELKKLNPSEEQFKLSFLNKEFKNNKIPRYILEKIEDKISSGEKGVRLDFVQLEHIMPKKIDKWEKYDPQYLQNTYDTYINNIGNMVLLSKTINASIKNSLFNDKKNKYEGSEVNMVSEIKAKDKWTKDEIEWNSNRYYEIAKQVWEL